jgi:hypothetical protein
MSDSEQSSGRSRRRAWGRALLLAWSLGACSLDFDVSGRTFACPPEVLNCIECNSDGSCRIPQVIENQQPDHPKPPPVRPDPPLHHPDAGKPDTGGTPPVAPRPDAGTAPPVGPTVPEECAAYGARTTDVLCVDGDEHCFSLGNVLSPSLTTWLDPTSLPPEGARYWCDRSGTGHHARLVPDAELPLVEPDGRAAGDALARSLRLDGGWLELAKGSEPALRPGNFAVVLAAATPLEASDAAGLALFQSGEASTLTLTLTPATAALDSGRAEGKISSLETSLVPDPVVTRSSVYDGRFHLYTLYRRSEVRVLDDVLQLRLNGVLEFRQSSIAIPRALDLSSESSPRIGTSDTSGAPTGRGRVAAVIILRGSVPEDELARLENFLCEALSVCAAPGPRLGTEPTPVDGGL